MSQWSRPSVPGAWGTPSWRARRWMFTDRTQRRRLRWRVRIVVVMRVLLVISLSAVIASLLAWHVDDHAITIDGCFAGLGSDDAQRTCALARLAAHDRAAESMRDAIVALVTSIVGLALFEILVGASYRKLLLDQLQFDQQLIDAIPLPVALRSPRGVFIRVNPAFELQYGVEQNQLAEKPWDYLFSRSDLERLHAMDREAMETDHPVEQSFEVNTAHGTRHLLMRLSALRRVDRSVLGLVSVQTDVTAMRDKELELVESNDRLKQISTQLMAAQEAERRRIARDLHDEVGQILTVLKLQLGALSRLPEIQHPADALLVPIDMAEQVLRHTRSLSASLHPHVLDNLGLAAALEWLVERFVRAAVPLTELSCTLDPPRVLPHVELAAFRVLQEALTNVIRHASATRIGVLAEASDGWLTLEVLDDGVGFESGDTWFDQHSITSLGLTSMHERVEDLGGDVRIESKPGKGTLLRARLPWTPVNP